MASASSRRAQWAIRESSSGSGAEVVPTASALVELPEEAGRNRFSTTGYFMTHP